MTHIAGQRSGNSVVPYSQTTPRTKEISTTSTTDITITITGWTTHTVPLARFHAYADSQDNWRLNYNVYVSRATGAGAANTYGTITFAGNYPVVFNTVKHQACSGFSGTTGAPTNAQSIINSGNVKFYHAASNEEHYHVSGDVSLASEPTWAAANMEASTDASIWIEPATSTVAGLLSYYDEGNFTVDINSNGVVISGWTINYIRIGKQVTMWWNNLTGQDINGTSTFANSAASTIPTSLLPTGDTQYLLWSVSSTVTLRIAITNGGIFGLGCIDGGNITAGTVVGASSITYGIA